MKIVYLHHANVYRAGIERMLAVKANLLAEQMGWEIMMLTYEQNGKPFPYPLSPKVKCVDLGVHLYDAYKCAYPMRWFRRRALCRKLAEEMRVFLSAEHPDIVVCTDKDAHELDALSKARTTERIFIEAHTGMIDHDMQVLRVKGFVKKLIARRDLNRLKKAVSHFDTLIALTPDDAKCWSPYVKTVIIPNYLPSYPEQVADLSVEKKRVVMVGRVDYQKGQDLLLQAWQQVNLRHPDWHLDMFGDSDASNVFRSHLSGLHAESFTFHPSTPAIYDEYLQSDFLVCSSRWESFGLILIEAMSCGIPVVSFNCDNGPRNIIADGEDGLLVRNGDIADLANKICWLIEHREQREQMGGAARQNVKRFCQDIVLSQYVEFLENACRHVQPSFQREQP